MELIIDLIQSIASGIFGMMFVSVLLAPVMLVIALLVSLAFGIYRTIASVITGISVWKISKKIGVQHGWLHFIQIAKYWILGRLAEEHQRRCAPHKKAVPWRYIYVAAVITYAIAQVLLVVGLFATDFLLLTIDLGDASDIILAVPHLLFVVARYGLLAAITAFSWYMRYKIYDTMIGNPAKWMIVLVAFVPVTDLVFMPMLAFGKRYPKQQPSVLQEDVAVDPPSQKDSCEEAREVQHESVEPGDVETYFEGNETGIDIESGVESCFEEQTENAPLG